VSIAIAIAYAQSLVGVPYIFKGDNPLTGFDCSGFVSEILRMSGELAWNERLSAQMLYDKYSKSNDGSGYFAAGYLAFYGTSVLDIDHVAFMISPHLVIEAGGGDHTTLTKDDAAKRDAFVRIRPVKYRKDFLLTIKPAYSKLGMFQP
jgi:cell wall-associated NlpC family hydrolase